LLANHIGIFLHINTSLLAIKASPGVECHNKLLAHILNNAVAIGFGFGLLIEQDLRNSTGDIEVVRLPYLFGSKLLLVVMTIVNYPEKYFSKSG